MGYMKDQHGYVGSNAGRATHNYLPRKETGGFGVVVFCFLSSAWIFIALFLLMTSLLLFVLILRSTYLAGLIFLAMPSKFQLDKKFFLSLVHCS
jgi:hypothetical protein